GVRRQAAPGRAPLPGRFVRRAHRPDGREARGARRQGGALRAGAGRPGGDRPGRGRGHRQRGGVRPVGRRLHARHQRGPPGRGDDRRRHRVRERAHHRRRDRPALRGDQAHRKRVPGGGHARHQTVQSGEERVRRLLAAPAAGPDRQPPARAGGDGGMSTQEWLDRDARVLAGVLYRYFDVVAERGQGSWVVDAEGRRYLDLAAGIAVVNVGHCHPRVVEAIQRQAATLIHTSIVVHNQPNVELAERLARLCPFLDEPQVFFCNSGAESVDGVIKMARKTTGRPGVIAFTGGFHGRTLAATSLTTAKARYRAGYGPLLPGVYHAPYCVPRPGGRGQTAAVASALAGLDQLLAAVVAPSEVAAMVVEPVLGEGGYVVPPVAWLQGLRRRCDADGILLGFDEVQCGVGRTGRFFAAETFGVAPDAVLFAKGIASGLPLGGIVAPRRLMEAWPPGC